MLGEERDKEVGRLECVLNELEHECFKITEALKKLDWGGWVVMKKYLVALRTGGEMGGNPSVTYHNHQVIEAVSKDKAEDEYNRINKCSYYYGQCLGETDGVNVIIPIKEFEVD